MDHECNAQCDPEDDEHKELRRALNIALLRAQAASDQAWTHTRNNLNKYIAIRSKLRGFICHVKNKNGGRISLSLAEWEYLGNALSIVIGETRRRKSVSED